MSEAIARAALTRMNLTPIAIAVHGSTMMNDMQSLSLANHEVEEKRFLEQRRAELCAAYGLNDTGRQEKQFAFSQGVAIIPFSGTMINRFGSSYGWATGYNFIRRQMVAASNDPDVKMIVGDFNTYGGEAAGCFETADILFEMRGKKPMLAVIDSNCYSAGYALASSFDKIVCTPSGGAGSIGVVSMHVNMGPMLDKIGYEITFIQFGKHKTDGNPYGKLPDEVKARLQAGINTMGKAFCELVARNREMDYKAVVDTQAECYNAQDALSLGLIDAIATPSQAVQAFYDDLSGSDSETEEDTDMSKQTEATPGSEDANAAANKLAQDAAVKAAIAADRERQQSILGCDEAKGKQKLANRLAFKTDMSADDAKAMLADAGLEVAPAAEKPAAPAATTNVLKEAMDKSAQPNVGADGEGSGNEGSPDANAAASILRDQAAYTGLKLVS